MSNNVKLFEIRVNLSLFPRSPNLGFAMCAEMSLRIALVVERRKPEEEAKD
jgi:hypothetical protein